MSAEDIRYSCYRSHTFTEVHADDYTSSNEHKWNTVDYFLADWKLSPFYTLTSYTEGSPAVTKYILEDNDVKIIFWLLYANYGNSHIASNDETRFKQQLFSLMYRYAPTYIKKRDIQFKLRQLNLDNGDLFKGTITVYNTADNPQTTPANDAMDPLTYINSQSANGTKKGKLEAYSQLWNLLEIDVVQEFLSKFKDLFIKVVTPLNPLLFCEDEE